MTSNATNSPASSTVEPLLTVRGLGKDLFQCRQFTGTKNRVCAFDGVDLTVRRGRTLAIVGESGAGKSTLARCIALLEEPTRGEIWIEGRNVSNCARRDFKTSRAKIQMIFQDPASSLNPVMTAEQIVAEPLAIQRLGTTAERRYRVLELLEKVGFSPECRNKRPFEFSGGQKQRLAIARALSLEPKLLVLDEACSALDVRTQHTILELLQHLQSTLGMSFIHVSHDLRMVADFSDEIAVMYRGSIVEQNSTAELMANPLNSYTRELLAAMPCMEEICEQRLVGASR